MFSLPLPGAMMGQRASVPKHAMEFFPMIHPGRGASTAPALEHPSPSITFTPFRYLATSPMILHHRPTPPHSARRQASLHYLSHQLSHSSWRRPPDAPTASDIPKFRTHFQSLLGCDNLPTLPQPFPHLVFSESAVTADEVKSPSHGVGNHPPNAPVFLSKDYPHAPHGPQSLITQE